MRYLSTYVTANGDHLGNHEATTALNMRGNPINNVTNPTNPTDAVNLQTMDSAIKTVTDSVSDLEAVSVTGGAGLLGGGDLTQDRVIDFDITWGDGRYAMRSRQLLAGTGLTGGGNLHADRTISLDVTYADNRFVNNAGNEAISGSKSFTSPVVVPAPTANSHATNKNYVDNAMASAPGTIYSAGDGLTLSAGNQFAVNSSVIRTTGDQNLNGVKNFVGTLQHFHNSNVADGSMKFGRNANQYIQLHGGSNANFLTSVSPESDDRPLRIRLQNGAIEHEYQFFSNGIIRGVADPANPIDAANKAYVDQAEADAVAAAGAQVINTGLGLVGGGSIDSGLTIAVQSDMWRRNASDPNHGLLAYNGHSPTSGQFYGGSSNPNYTNRLNYGGSFYATNFYSTNYYYFSDENLKDDIETISADSGMDTVRKLRPVSYTWKEGGAEALGLIAQEVEDVAPSAVTTNEAGTMAVDYIQLMAPMLAAIQELDARVTALEAKID